MSGAASSASRVVERLAAEPPATLLQVSGDDGSAMRSLRADVRPLRHLLFSVGAAAPSADDGCTIVHGVKLRDEWRLTEELDRFLGGDELDAVVDDGTHHLLDARSLFEVAFPRLRKGGRYLLVDWDWSHRGIHGPGIRDDEPALTNLLVELVMLAGTDPGAVRSIVVEQGVAEIVRGDGALAPGFQLAGAYENRGIRYRPVL